MAVRRQRSKQMEAAAGTVAEAPAPAVAARPAGRAPHDAAVRPGRPGPRLQSGHRRGPAQPRLCLRHARAWRADARLGRSVLLASARSRGDPHQPEARRRDHRRGAAARHDRGHRGDARGDRPAVRPRDRPSGRGPHQAEEARPRHARGQAGREPAQAAACDRRRRARAAGQARRPPAQHAHAGVRAGGLAPAHRRGDARHLCAARRPHGHAGDARGAGGSCVPRARSRRLCGRHRAAECARRAQPQPDRRDRKPAGRQSRQASA